MIDKNGFRRNVGMIILNDDNQVFWAKRVRQKAWQFPQGGVDKDESATQAMYRELKEETGLLPEHVELIASTKNWLTYRLPIKFQRKNDFPRCVGQKQKWFLLRLRVKDDLIDFNSSKKAEFEDFKWVNYWYPIKNVIYFKKSVYKRALKRLAKYLKNS